MKKILTALVLFVFAVLPMSVMAMQTISDNELSTTTGQAGVSINLDTSINLTTGTLAWGDKDGLGTTEASGAGWVGVNSLNANLRVKLREDLIRTALSNMVAGETFRATYAAEITAYGTAAVTLIAQYNATYHKNLPIDSSANISNAIAYIQANAATYNPTVLPGYPAFGAAATALNTLLAANTAAAAYIGASNAISPLTIDVATDSGTAHGAAGTTFVRIGLGSLGIYVSSVSATVALGGGATVPTLNQELGSIYISDMTILVSNASYVDIYNGRGAGTQGVTLGLNVKIDSISIGALSWGDADGFVTTNYAPYYGSAPGTTTPTNSPINNVAGYVGLIGTTIAGVGIYGPVTIDVATDAAGGKQATHATTFVRIGFAGLNLQVGAIDATAVIGTTNNFSAGTFDTFGTIYLSGLNITFGTGSLDIYNYYGQSGVVLDFTTSIAALNIATLSWGDGDGLGAYSNTTNGFVGLKDLAIANLAINGIVTINVATVEAGNALVADYGVGRTFVRMGFDDVAISMGSMDATVALGSAKNNLAQELGDVYVGGLTATVNGNVDIMAASGSQGVVLVMDVSVATTPITAISWGDLDGIGGATTAGFVGLKNLTIGALTVVGKVSIDVATVDMTTVTPNSTITLMYHAYDTHSMSPVSNSFVHIGLGTGNAENNPASAGALAIGIAGMSADVALDSAKGLSGAGLSGSGLLGSFYIGSLNARINGWVDIAAH